MPTKKSPASGRDYDVTGRQLVWHPLDDDGEMPDITIPLRMKLKVIRALSQRDTNDADTMFAMLDAIIPDQADVLDEMDVNDCVDMFQCWQSEYNAMAGASLGESERSSS